MVPAAQEVEVGGSHEPGRVEAADSHGHTTTLQPEQQSKTLSPKRKKTGQVWQLTPVIPATQKAEA